ncbi:hypothetical protein OH492_00025 [Vibrio chagasii]|nr:hypothetical protein [Vibrio chagasii]
MQTLFFGDMTLIHMARLESERANNEFLPNIDFPESLIIESDLEKAVTASRRSPQS